MADRYWVGGTGNWSNTAMWSATSGGAGGASVPTAADNVIFNTASSTGAYNVTLNVIANCLDFTANNPTSGNLNFIGGGGPFPLNCYGNFFTDTNINFTTTLTLVFLKASSTGKTVSTSGVNTNSLLFMYFDNAAGGWTVTSNLTNMGDVVIYGGNVNFSGRTITVGTTVTGRQLTATTSATKTIDFSGATVTVGAVSGGGGYINLGSSTGLTLITDASTVFNLYHTNGVATSFYNNFSFNGTFNVLYNTSGAWIFTIPTSTFNNLNISTTVNGTGANIVLSGNLTVTGLLTVDGKSNTNRTLIRSSVGATQRTINAASISFSSVDIQNINATGAANWNISSITGLSGDLGNNLGITFTSPTTSYFKTSVSCNWSDSSKWVTTSGGSTTSRVPLPQDTGIFDANSFSTTGIIVTRDTTSEGNIDFTSVTNAPRVNTTVSDPIKCGTTKLSSNLLSSSSYDINYIIAASNSSSIDPNGYTGGGTWYLGAKGSSVNATFNLLSNITSTGGVYTAAGNFNSNSYDITATSFRVTSSAPALVSLGSSVITVSSGSSHALYIWSTAKLAANTAQAIISNASRNIYLGLDSTSAPLDKLTITADNANFQVNGTTKHVETLELNTAGLTTGTIIPASGTLRVGGITTNASAGNLVKIKSSSTTRAIINCPNYVQLDYLDLKDMNCSGRIPFYAGEHSTNSGNNLNWAFYTKPPYNFSISTGTTTAAAGKSISKRTFAVATSTTVAAQSKTLKKAAFDDTTSTALNIVGKAIATANFADTTGATTVFSGTGVKKAIYSTITQTSVSVDSKTLKSSNFVVSTGTNLVANISSLVSATFAVSTSTVINAEAKSFVSADFTAATSTTTDFYSKKLVSARFTLNTGTTIVPAPRAIFSGSFAVSTGTSLTALIKALVKGSFSVDTGSTCVGRGTALNKVSFAAPTGSTLNFSAKLIAKRTFELLTGTALDFTGVAQGLIPPEDRDLQVSLVILKNYIESDKITSYTVTNVIQEYRVSSSIVNAMSIL